MNRYRGKAVLSVDGMGEAPCSIDMDGASIRVWPLNWTSDLRALALPAAASLRMPTGATLSVSIVDRAVFHGFLEMTITEPSREAERPAAPHPRPAE